MSDPTTLIPNLHEVMEEYTEMENKIKQGFEATTKQVEERDDDNEENHQKVDEPRKRKSGVDEAGKEKRKNRVENLISESEVALMEGSLKNRGFIAEREFKNIISPFSEMVEKREWQSLAKHKEPRCASLLMEFFANMVEREGKRVYVRGQWIDFSREEINKLFNLGVQKDVSKFRKQLREIEHQKIVDLLTVGK